MRTKRPSFNRWYNTRSGNAFQMERATWTRHKAYQPNPEGFTIRELVEYILSARRARQSDSVSRKSMRQEGVPGEAINEAFAELDSTEEADEAFDPYGD